MPKTPPWGDTAPQILTEEDRLLLKNNGVSDPEQWLADLQNNKAKLARLRSKNQQVDPGGAGADINVRQVLVTQGKLKDLTKQQKQQLADENKRFTDSQKVPDGTIQTGFNGETFQVGKAPPPGQPYKVVGAKTDENGRFVSVDLGTAVIADKNAGVKGLTWKTVQGPDGSTVPVKPPGAGESAIWRDPFSGQQYAQDTSAPVTAAASSSGALGPGAVPILGGVRIATPNLTGASPTTNAATQALAGKVGASLNQEQGNISYQAPGTITGASGQPVYNSAYSGGLAGNEVLLGANDDVVNGQSLAGTMPGFGFQVGPTARTADANGNLTDQFGSTQEVRGVDGQVHRVQQTPMTVDDQRKRLMTMSPAELKLLQTSLFTAGYYPKSTTMGSIQVGVADAATQQAWDQVLRDTLSYNAAGVLKTPDEVVAERAGINQAKGLTGGQAPPTIDPRDAAQVADAAALQLFGRKASPEEQRMIIYAVNSSMKGAFQNQMDSAQTPGPTGGLQAANPSSVAMDVLQQEKPGEAASYGIVNSLDVLTKMLGPAVQTGGN